MVSKPQKKKGLNETKIKFKLKPIVIQKQAKDLNNIKNILKHLKHYNANIRKRAVEELANNVKLSKEEIFQRNSSEICLAISNLMQDKEYKVRKAAIKCLDTILTCIPSKHLIAYRNYFEINIRCAMTSLNKNIQKDAILFSDCFIKKKHVLSPKTCVDNENHDLFFNAFRN